MTHTHTHTHTRCVDLSRAPPFIIRRIQPISPETTTLIFSHAESRRPISQSPPLCLLTSPLCSEPHSVTSPTLCEISPLRILTARAESENLRFHLSHSCSDLFLLTPLSTAARMASRMSTGGGARRTMISSSDSAGVAGRRAMATLSKDAWSIGTAPSAGAPSPPSPPPPPSPPSPPPSRNGAMDVERPIRQIPYPRPFTPHPHHYIYIYIYPPP